MRQREYRQRQAQLKSYGGSLEEQLIQALQERQLTRAEKNTLAKEQKRRKQNERTRNYRRRKAAEIPKKTETGWYQSEVSPQDGGKAEQMGCVTRKGP